MADNDIIPPTEAEAIDPVADANKKREEEAKRLEEEWNSRNAQMARKLLEIGEISPTTKDLPDDKKLLLVKASAECHSISDVLKDHGIDVPPKVAGAKKDYCVRSASHGSSNLPGFKEVYSLKELEAAAGEEFSKYHPEAAALSAAGQQGNEVGVR